MRSASGSCCLLNLEILEMALFSVHFYALSNGKTGGVEESGVFTIEFNFNHQMKWTFKISYALS